MSDELGARWDWYEATIDGVDDGRIPIAMAIAFGATVTPGKGRNGYAHCDVIERDGDVLVQVYGHSARSGEVHITITSESCDEVVPWLRSRYPDHRVSRADSAVDFSADFDAIDAQVLAFAQARGLSYRLVTDSDGGSTRYIGSPRSETRLRVYKKSEQLRAMHPDKADEIPDGIVRAELVGRPGKRDFKERVAGMTPNDLWGLSQWSTELAALVLGFEPERTRTHFRLPSDWSRAMYFVGRQYGPSVAKRAEQVGREQAAAEVLAALGLS